MDDNLMLDLADRLVRLLEKDESKSRDVAVRTLIRKLLILMDA